MEGKDYPTRSKSGVRKTRTPWDNSSSVLFDQLVGVKRSPKTPPTDGKGGHTPSPKVGGKKTPSSAGKASAKEKKVLISPLHYLLFLLFFLLLICLCLLLPFLLILLLLIFIPCILLLFLLLCPLLFLLLCLLLLFFLPLL